MAGILESDYNNGDYELVFEIILHEMTHLLTEPLYHIAWESRSNSTGEFIELIREQQTQRTTNCLLALYPKKDIKPLMYESKANKRTSKRSKKKARN